MPLFDDEVCCHYRYFWKEILHINEIIFFSQSNKRIRYYMKMWGHLNDCFEMISNEMSRFTPEQISYQ